MDELVQLWKGVVAYDVLKDVGARTFKLRAVLMWTIHDFPGYGTVAGVAHQGYAVCPVCGPHFKGEHSVSLGHSCNPQVKKTSPFPARTQVLVVRKDSRNDWVTTLWH